MAADAPGAFPWRSFFSPGCRRATEAWLAIPHLIPDLAIPDLAILDLAILDLAIRDLPIPAGPMRACPIPEVVQMQETIRMRARGLTRALTQAAMAVVFSMQG